MWHVSLIFHGSGLELSSLSPRTHLSQSSIRTCPQQRHQHRGENLARKTIELIFKSILLFLLLLRDADWTRLEKHAVVSLFDLSNLASSHTFARGPLSFGSNETSGGFLSENIKKPTQTSRYKQISRGGKWMLAMKISIGLGLGLESSKNNESLAHRTHIAGCKALRFIYCVAMRLASNERIPRHQRSLWVFAAFIFVNISVEIFVNYVRLLLMRSHRGDSVVTRRTTPASLTYDTKVMSGWK